MKHFINYSIGTYACNLRCHYVAQNITFTQKVPDFKYFTKYIGKALSKKRLGETYMFNICAAGETLIPPKVIDYTKAILKEGHYLMIVTNGMLTKRFGKFAELLLDYRKRLFFKVSYHFLELKRLNKFDVFFKNIELISFIYRRSAPIG